MAERSKALRSSWGTLGHVRGGRRGERKRKEKREENGERNEKVKLLFCTNIYLMSVFLAA